MNNEVQKKGKCPMKIEGFHIEPFLWALFGNGGTIAAMIFPVVVLLFGVLLPIGIYDPANLYDNLYAFYGNIIGKLIIFALLAFNLWHACHRIYHATHDFKFHPPLWVKFCIYSVAALGTLIILGLLF